MSNSIKNIVVVGPTGSGKSALAVDIANEINGEIISCDSVQIYRGFDIGSAKDSATAKVPIHMINIVDWDQEYDAALYAEAARKCHDKIIASGKVPVIVGGTGLYLRSFWGQGWSGDIPKNDELRQKLEARTQEDLYSELSKIDPRRAGEIHKNDKFRIVRALEINYLTGSPVASVATENPGTRAESHLINIDPDRAVLHKKIAARTQQMLVTGLVQEVRGLLENGVKPTCKPMQSIGYKQVAAFLAGELPESELKDRIIFATRQYAKRQTTWFRSVPHEQKIITNDLDEIKKNLPTF